jgi:hypothetical protein
MKHIKTYENNNSLYKKYIVTDFLPYHDKQIISHSHYIFRVLPKSTEDMLFYDSYYYINEVNNKLVTTKDTNYYTNYKNKIFDIIYQTNSLKDASDFLYSLQEANKFNL